MFCCLFICESPTEQITVFPRTRREFQPERHSIRVKHTRNDDRRRADRIHPGCITARSTAWTTVRLWNGLVIRRHLQSRIDVAVEMKTIESLFKHLQGL